MLEEYTHLIADPTKRRSLEFNEIIEFISNRNTHCYLQSELFFSALSSVKLSDQMTTNVAQGLLEFNGAELTILVHRIRKPSCFDKFRIGVKRYGEDFVAEEVIEETVETVSDWSWLEDEADLLFPDNEPEKANEQ